MVSTARIQLLRRSAEQNKRDGAVDLARAACLVVVVLFHGIMMGVQPGATGWQVTNAFEGQSFFPVLSLFLQVMPLFFILGGFSSYGAWQRRRAAGSSAASFIGQRLLRLARPASVVFGVVGVALAVLGLIGIPPALIAQIGFRISQPMWFLAVYLGCSAAVPLLAAAHRRARWATLLGLTAGVVGVELLRSMSGWEAIGYLNLIFVWATIQQLGFFYADRLASGIRRSPASLLAGFAACTALLLIGAAGGLWPLDMLENLNPPRLPLLLLGLAQLALLELLRPRLQAALELPLVRRVSDFINTASLTIYLWHASVMTLLIGAILLFDLPMPAPLSPAWWASRASWLLTLLLVMTPFAAVLRRFEGNGRRFEDHRRLGGRQHPGLVAKPPRRIAAAMLLAVSAVVVILALGAQPTAWLLGCFGLATAVDLVSASSRTADLHLQSFSARTWWPAGHRAILN